MTDDSIELKVRLPEVEYDSAAKMYEADSVRVGDHISAEQIRSQGAAYLAIANAMDEAEKSLQVNALNTKKAIALALKLSDAATPGPWHADTGIRGDVVVWGPDGAFISNAQAEPHWTPAPDGRERMVQFDVDRRDAEFIAAARTLLPAFAKALSNIYDLLSEEGPDISCAGYKLTDEGCYAERLASRIDHTLTIPLIKPSL